jgi:hypothetical protein
MSFSRSAGQFIATAIAAWFLVCGLSGAVCAVVVCHENPSCDPCVTNSCKCQTDCHHGALDARTSHRLSHYKLSIAEPSAGTVARTLSEIAGLSLDVADGPIEHTAADFRRFAEGVIEVNGLVLRPMRGTWTARSVEAFPEAIVVGFAGSVDPAASLEFLFDRRGNLLEIDETRNAAR